MTDGTDEARAGEEKGRNASSQRQTCPVASPPVQCQQLPATLVLLAEVFRNSAAHLSEGATHNPAEVAL